MECIVKYFKEIDKLLRKSVFPVFFASLRKIPNLTDSKMHVFSHNNISEITMHLQQCKHARIPEGIFPFLVAHKLMTCHIIKDT